MNTVGLTNVQPAIQENVSISNDMYNYQATLGNQSTGNNGTVLYSRSTSLSNSPVQQPVDIWNFSKSVDKQPTKEEFYRSYDPNIGLHTAAVLGGILVWLIIYLVYRTRCKSAIIRFCKGLSEQRNEKKRASACNFRRQSRMGADTPSIIVTAEKPDVKSNHVEIDINSAENPRTDIYQSDTHPSDKNPDIPVILHKLPSLETDAPTATAQWVKEQPLSIQSLQDLPGAGICFCSGIIKLPNSCPVVRDPRLIKSSSGLATSWNKSLPSLSHNIEVVSLGLSVPSSEQRDSGIQKPTRPRSSEIIPTQQRFLPKLTISIPDSSANPSELNLEDFSLSVPIPVTPTVKIQNYTSKRSAHTASLHRKNSDESLSSNSSADPLLVEPELPNMDCWHNRVSKHQIWPSREILRDKSGDLSSVSLLSDENITETVL